MAVNNRSNRDSNSNRVTAMVIAMESSPVMQNEAADEVETTGGLGCIRVR